ncbi:PTS system cellobiose-specific IIA component [Orenia metallireducens]|jgi:PTS system cellobiose-specific IIA component|uniref:PTS system, cellobiose-specific IIA component n=1 Tax=Orenia metallireducens TaxID=1413210 RepID=A0A285GCK5_9FIRM|nr:PTS lactose/cellobiose transporter subunit IIA [Orenia metallireducens]PRX32475.1 PTS system cellobiose-specific IIA component [Orenia metallireducens]SNY21148.1 PTS system, cellobiose-specific IIA component [Orenia metallireducens]
MSSEEIVFKIITEAGNAKGVSFEAFALAKEGKFAEAEEKLKEANQFFHQAHDIQTELITKEAQGQKNEVSILMVHAQDHLAGATLAKDLIAEMIQMQKEIHNLKIS